jgi:hypothetical protein
MNLSEPVTADVFQNLLNEIMAGLPAKKLPVDMAKIAEFCRLTGHDFEQYRKKDLIPLGYLMTFTTPLINEAFMTFFTKHPSLIKGVVHSNSTIEVFHPFRLSHPFYMEELSVRQVLDKEGRRGKSFVTDFAVLLKNPEGETVLCDLHQFFLKR